MKSALRGKPTSKVEVSNVAPGGFWLLLDERELFLPFKEFPWFQDATIREITTVERPRAHHLYWPELDIDLAVESIEHPDRFPLVSRARPNKASQRTGRKPARRHSR
ncbi:MAG TPA: DUF2442 domain-containing protein [Polyangia bacterium]|jgi:hypothetical protein|nr:DUF2442 domain-containing protein [Polyangia bacterium]